MTATKLAISVLGNFLSYRNAEYVIESNETEIVEHTRSSVVAIARAKRVDKIILLIPFSVAIAVCPELILSGKLEDAKKELSAKAINFMKLEIPEETSIETYVLPNVGTFKLAGSGRLVQLLGSSGTFHEAVYLSIFNCLKPLGKLEIHMDVTHAINSLILDAVDAIISSFRTLSAIDKVQGSVRIYYSDPYVSDSPDTPLHIRAFKRELMESSVSSSSMLLSDFVANFNFNDYQRSLKPIDLPEFSDPRSLKKIAYNHNMGCVLLTSSLNDSLMKWKNGILKMLEYNISQPEDKEVDNQENLMRIQMSQKIERELSAAYSVLEIMTSSPFRKGKEPSLEDLKEMSRYIAPPGFYLIKQEIDYIKEISKRLNEGQNLLGQLIEGSNEASPKHPFSKSKYSQCKTNDRNFIAHAGLERNVTWLIRNDKDIHLSYGPCLEEIKKSVRVFK